MAHDAKVTWTGDMHFKAESDSAYTWTLDADAAVGGQAMGPRPMELLLIGLAGCTGMDVISILRKKRQDVTGFEVRAYGDQADDFPRVYTDIRIEYVVRGRDVDPQAVERSIELSQTKYCPVTATLSELAEISTDYRIEEVE